ncbi:hypothetical protein [Siphonobacter curvatus]|uniref:Uncharacterized protein n=1 Tax=Siphonobacter curvatus TaxID=2094562 RepID=A0A2S7IR17_9BACT|nr:hypothetical protein [Siphonobacter curvatus]PQA60161.1 hypothetical protein C5O19_11240 [Siphonobacter curvatus]
MNNIPTMQEVAQRVHADHYKGTINGIILAGVIPEYGGEPSIYMNTKVDTEWLKWVGVLANAAREVNGEWEPNWNDEKEEKWFFEIDADCHNHIGYDYSREMVRGNVVFMGLSAMIRCREILNEWSKQQGLEEDGILLRALGVVKGCKQ